MSETAENQADQQDNAIVFPDDGNLFIVVGEPGSGKTRQALRAAMELALQGKSAMFLTRKLVTLDAIQLLKDMGYTLDQIEGVIWNDKTLQTKESILHIEDVFDAIESAEKTPDYVFIDSFQLLYPLVKMPQDDVKRALWITFMDMYGDVTGSTFVLTMKRPDGMSEDEFIRAFEADGYYMLATDGSLTKK